LHHKGATVWIISPQATVFEAIQLLARKNIGALPVVEADKLVARGLRRRSPVRETGTDSGADLGGSSNYSNGNFED